MGQKVNPNGLRIGITQTWSSMWFAQGSKYSDLLHQDIKIRKEILKSVEDAGIPKIDIERSANKVNIGIHTSKPGLIIGQQGSNIDKLKDHLEKKFGQEFVITIKEIGKPELSSQLVAENVAKQIERRVSYRRAVKQAMDKTIESGALGVKVKVSGRLNGVDIARSEFFSKGKVPLHTLRADINYGYTIANTKFGVIGIKAWVYKGEVFDNKNIQELINK